MKTTLLRIPSFDSGVFLSMIAKRPARKTSFTGEEIILFVHGSVSPGCCWDVSLPGGSWMEYAASRGFMTYAFDFRGYGLSTRPASMQEEASANPPYCRTADAVRDLAAAVAWILREHAVLRIHLVGWSWGCVVAGQYTAGNNDKVARLGLYAPVHILPEASPDTDDHYRSITEAAYRKSALLGIPEGREEEIFPLEWFNRVWEKVLASDSYGSTMSPPVMRAPTGCAKDMHAFFSHGASTYDPGGITVPTLICVGEWDLVTPVATALMLFQALTGSPERRLEVLPESTHFMLHEKNRMMLLKQMHHFLEGGELEPR